MNFGYDDHASRSRSRHRPTNLRSDPTGEFCQRTPNPQAAPAPAASGSSFPGWSDTRPFKPGPQESMILTAIFHGPLPVTYGPKYALEERAEMVMKWSR